MVEHSRYTRSAQRESNYVDIWRPRNVHSIELHRGYDVTLDYPRHWHDEIYLCAILKGVSYLDCHGTSNATHRGTLAIVPPGEVHANRKIGCTFRCIFMQSDALQKTLEQFVEQSISRVDVGSALIGNSQTTTDFLRLHRSLEDPCSELEQDYTVASFLYQFVRRHGYARISTPYESREHVAVERTKLFLEEHYSEPISLGDLARLTGLSPYHLNRSFCKIMGMPPHAFQLQIRIAQAKKFLEQGRSAAETASLTGFFDQSHFTHQFRRSERITPGQYLRNRKNLQDNRAYTQYF